MWNIIGRSRTPWRPECASLSAARKSRQVLGQINWVLYVEEKFEGNAKDYYDPRNSFVNEVIEPRKGIPISLSLLYQAIAVQVGLPLSGVNLPAHFMLGLDKRSRPSSPVLSTAAFAGPQPVPNASRV